MELKQFYGGPSRGFIVVDGPVVKAVIVREDLNPEAPEVIRAGDGPRRSKWKATLRSSRDPFDVWIRKLREDVYTYVGSYCFDSEDPSVEVPDRPGIPATTYSNMRLRRA